MKTNTKLPKKILFIPIFIFIHSFLFGQINDLEKDTELPNWKIDKLNDRVESIKEIAYEFVEENGETIKKKMGPKLFSEYGEKEYKYDQQGRITSISTGEKSETIKSFKYNDSDFTATSEIISNGKVNYRNEYRLNSEGKLLENNWYDATKLLRKFVQEFNEQNQLTSLKTFGPTNDLTRERQFIYDEQGNLTEAKVFDFRKSVGTAFQYINDSLGRPIEENNVAFDFFYSPDDDDYSVFNSDPGGKIINQYNDQGNKILRQQYYFSGELMNTEYYEYDTHQNLVETKRSSRDGKPYLLSHFEYQYDEKGNWISKSIFEDGKVSILIEREIRYY